MSQRWGGWFVTGRIGIPHRGNAVGPESGFGPFVLGSTGRPANAFFDGDRYLTPHSDVVAHLVLAHQTRVHNSIARAAIEARKALAYGEQMQRIFGEPSDSVAASVRRRIEGPSEALVRDLLLAGAAPLRSAVRGDSGFAEKFQNRGPRDAAGRSLRDLDLTSRVFRYPFSYLIHSPAFSGLPAPVREYVERRIQEVLSGRDRTGASSHLTLSDRRAISSLLRSNLGIQ